MAKEIKRVEVVQEDIFKDLRESAVSTEVKVDALKTSLEAVDETIKVIKKDAAGIKGGLLQADPADVKAHKEIAELTKQVQQLTEKNARLTAAKAQATKQLSIEEAKLKEEIRKQNLEVKQQAKLQIAAKDSIEAMDAELAIVTASWKKLTAEEIKNSKEGQELNRRKTELTAKLKELRAATGDHRMEVGNYEKATVSLKKQLIEMTRALQNMDESHPDFNRMVAEAGQLRDKISDTKAVIEATAGSGMENMAKGFAGVGQIGINAFQGVEGAMALFGVESQAVMETLMRLQALAAMSDALEGLGGLGDKITEIKAAFGAAASQLGIFTALKKTDTVATNAQTVATGGATVATKLLGKSMNALPIIAIVAAIAALSAGIYSYIKSANDMTQKQKDLNATFDAYKDGAQGAIQKTQEVKVAFDLAKQGTISKKEALDKYNESLGDTFGHASNLNEAEKLYNEKTGAYIRATALRAQAQALLGMAAEEQVKAMTASMEDQRNLSEEAATVITDGIAAIVDYSTAGLTDLSEEADKAQAKLYKDAQAREKKRAESRANDLTKLAESLLKEAGMLEKNNGISLKHTETIKKETAARQKQEKVLKSNTKLLEREAEVRKSLFDPEAVEKSLRLDEERALLAADILVIEQEIALSRAQQSGDTAAIAKAEADLAKAREAQINAQLQLDLLGTDNVNEQEKLKKQAELDILNAQVEKKAEIEQKSYENTKKFIDLTDQYIERSIDKRIEMIDKEIEASQKREDMLREMAAQGNIDAQKSIAEEERIQMEKQLAKEKLERRKQQIAAVSAFFETYLNEREAGKSVTEAFAAASMDKMTLEAVMNSLPTFIEGTENVARSLGAPDLPGEDGYVVRVDGRERILNPDQNAQIGNMTNSELVSRIQMSKIMEASGNIAPTGWQSMAFVSELNGLKTEMRDVKKAIEDKPVPYLAVEDVAQNMIKVIQSEVTKSKTTRNSFIVKR